MTAPGERVAAGAQTTWYASSGLKVLCILGGAWTGLPTGGWPWGGDAAVLAPPVRVHVVWERGPDLRHEVRASGAQAVSLATIMIPGAQHLPSLRAHALNNDSCGDQRTGR